MKKLLTLMTFVFCLGASALYSQVNWYIEAQTGVASMSSLPSDNGCRFQWSAGGGASIRLSDVVHIAPSLLLSQRGATVSGYYGSEMIAPAKYSIRTNYLEMPVYLALHFGSNENLRFIIKTGPSFCYGLNGKVKVSARDSDFSATYPENLFSQSCTMDGIAQTANRKLFGLPKFNRFDLLWGTGFDVMLQKRFIIGLNVKVGLTKVTTEPITTNVMDQLVSLLFSHSVDSRNISASLSFAYQF
jgi:hypothetical protein